MYIGSYTVVVRLRRIAACETTIATTITPAGAGMG